MKSPCRPCNSTNSSLDPFGPYLAEVVLTESLQYKGKPLDSPQVLKKERLEESFQRLVTVNPGFRRGYGIGFQVLRLGEVVLYGHNGGLAGYQGEVYFDRNSRTGVIILRNAVGGSFNTARLLRAAFEAPPALPAK